VLIAYSTFDTFSRRRYFSQKIDSHYVWNRASDGTIGTIGTYSSVVERFERSAAVERLERFERIKFTLNG
jgi:hypothetical protein